ncbi:hypothetical protein LY76DRAFT_621256 [Colletotrichum caudatum]|nr:hypothetical protein LY76DRAFT_621256 [Colletotrichum caudatum]
MSLRLLLSKQIWKDLPESRDCTADENEKGEKEDGKEEEDDDDGCGDGDGDDNDGDEGVEDGERIKLHERRGADQVRETEMEANSNSDPQEAHPETVCTAGSNHGGNNRCGGIKNAISNHSVWPFYLPFSLAVNAGHQSTREDDTCQGERRDYSPQAFPRGHGLDSQKVEGETGVFSLEEIGECLEHMKRERRKKQREHGIRQCNE